MNNPFGMGRKQSLFTISNLLLAVAILFFAQSCKKEGTVTSMYDNPVIASSNDELIDALNLEGLPDVAHPADNATSDDKVELGRLLFWDPIIGGEKDMACATCHHPDFAYTDGLDLAIGVNGSGLGPDRTENTGGLYTDGTEIGRVPRNSPSVLNAAYNGLIAGSSYSAEDSPMFWDSRMTSFEDQCQGPPGSESEMRGFAYTEEQTFDSIMARLNANSEYVQLFEDAFGAGPIITENYAKAIGAFERTIVSANSPYDQYLAGDLNALTDQQKEGVLLFNGKGKCNTCHFGPTLSGYGHFVIGIEDNPAHPEGGDAGLDDLYKFRTPTLRNVGLTGPYMHNGMMTSLADIVAYKSAAIPSNPNVTEAMMDITPSDLTADEQAAVVAFLESLTDSDFDTTIPASVPSGLAVGGNIN